MTFEMERDSALRGWWVKGLVELNKKARAALLVWDGEETFIPDDLLRQIEEMKVLK